MNILKIGVISDTHDHIENITKAVKLFNEQGVTYVFHAGDYIAPFVIPKALNGLKCKLFGVYGNNDGEILGLKKKFTEIGATIEEGQLTVQIDNKKIALYHTLNAEIQSALTSSRKFDIIIFGHSHEASIEKVGDSLIINPGEACGYLTGKATIGIIDLDKMDAEIITI